ncbi:minor capsid protein [Lacticaseibacillus parakribbianus]|uniref:minor capsid protein n=1 Tax=Lacticaseibacillus parakribbianus TaxID=2970927 RepID=UPI0021CB1A5A|nr:minor capsid protein [Lacticaseibacillus parakribbianus]
MTTTVEFGRWADELANPADVERELASKVREDADPFVPRQDGNLSGDSADIIDSSIIYGAPYAHYVWFGQVMVGPKPKQYVTGGLALNYYTGKHKQAGADWVERAADVNMAGWERFVGERMTQS